MGMFILGWIIGVLSMFVCMVWIASKKKGVIGYTKNAKEAADMMMNMLNSNKDVRDDVKNRLNASD